jgi:hypothetical protein
VAARGARAAGPGGIVRPSRAKARSLRCVCRATRTARICEPSQTPGAFSLSSRSGSQRAAERQRPLSSRDRPSFAAVATAGMCQEPTYAPQQNSTNLRPSSAGASSVVDKVNIGRTLRVTTWHHRAAGFPLGSSVPTQALGGVQFKGKAAAVEIFAGITGSRLPGAQNEHFFARRRCPNRVTLRHPPMSAIRPLSGAQRTSAQRVIRSATRARDKPAGRAPWRPRSRRPFSSRTRAGARPLHVRRLGTQGRGGYALRCTCPRPRRGC